MTGTSRGLPIHAYHTLYECTNAKGIMAEKPKIAFIGLGSLGIGMALNLLQQGFPVTGFDVNPMTLETLLAMGGIAAPSAQECAQDASFLIFMVTNSLHTENAFFAEKTGAVLALAQNATIILCSTVTSEFPREMLDGVHQNFQRPDIQFIDCSVSGGTTCAAQGKLTIVASGQSGALNNAQSVLESMSDTLYEIEGALRNTIKVGPYINTAQTHQREAKMRSPRVRRTPPRDIRPRKPPGQATDKFDSQDEYDKTSLPGIEKILCGLENCTQYGATSDVFGVPLIVKRHVFLILAPKLKGEKRKLRYRRLQRSNRRQRFACFGNITCPETKERNGRY